MHILKKIAVAGVRGTTTQTDLLFRDRGAGGRLSFFSLFASDGAVYLLVSHSRGVIKVPKTLFASLPKSAGLQKLVVTTNKRVLFTQPYVNF